MSSSGPATLQRHLTFDDCATALAWDVSGSRLAAGALSGQVVVVEPGSGQVVPLPDHLMGTLALAWSGGGRLASGGQDGVVRIWAPHRGPLGRLEATGWCNALAWSPREEVLAAGVGSSLAVIGVAEDLEPSGEWHDGLPSTVTSLAWTPSGKWVGAGCYGGVQWFEPGAAEAVKVLERKGSVLSIGVSDDGKWLAAGNQDAEVRVWRLWSGEDLRMRGFAGKVTLLAWHPSSKWLSVGDGSAVASWSFRGKGPAGTSPEVIEGHDGPVTAMAYRPADGLLVTGSVDGTVRAWDRLDGRAAVWTIEVGDGVSSLAWHPAGGRLAVSASDGSVWTVDTP